MKELTMFQFVDTYYNYLKMKVVKARNNITVSTEKEFVAILTVIQEKYLNTEDAAKIAETIEVTNAKIAKDEAEIKAMDEQVNDKTIKFEAIIAAVTSGEYVFVNENEARSKANAEGREMLVKWFGEEGNEIADKLEELAKGDDKEALDVYQEEIAERITNKILEKAGIPIVSTTVAAPADKLLN